MNLLVVTAVDAERDAIGAGDDVIVGGVGPAASAAATSAALAARQRTTSCSARASAAASRRWASATSPSRRRSSFADLGAETAGRLRPGVRARLRRRPLRRRTRSSRSSWPTAPADTSAPSSPWPPSPGRPPRADALVDRFPDAVAEGMEGAGVAAAAALHGVPFAEIRAISNAVGPRDRDAWRIPDALAALGRAVAAVAAGWTAVRLAFSPCPNDTFVFHAWTHGLIADAPPVEVTFADIDVTNTAAERGEFDVVKVSYAALPWLLDRYPLLPSGGALGRGCGPLVLTRGDLADSSTGARSRCRASARRRTCCSGSGRPGQRPARIDVVPFAQIMPAVRDGRYDAGLVIHEARFTYPDYGLQLAGRPRRVVGAATPGCRSRSARSWPGASLDAAATQPGGARVGRVRLGAPGRRRRDYVAEHAARDVAGRAAAPHRPVRQRVHPRPRRGGLRRGRGAARPRPRRRPHPGDHPALRLQRGRSRRGGPRRRGCRRTRAAGRRPCGPRPGRGSGRGAASWTCCRAA